MADVNVTSLKEYDYFTTAKANGKKLEFNDPAAGYYLDYDKKETVLTLHFLLPLKQPVKAKDLTLEVFDREFFVDFSFAEKDPAKLVGAPNGDVCANAASSRPAMSRRPATTATSKAR